MLTLLLWACSTNLTVRVDCQNSSECYSNFGAGYVCEQNSSSDNVGYCVESSGIPRCTNTNPPGLFEDWANRRNDYLVGSLYDDYVLEIEGSVKSIDLVADRLETIGDRNVTVVHCDYSANIGGDGLSGEEAIRVGTQFLADELQIPLIIGPYTSQEVRWALNYNDSAIMISPSATASILKDLSPRFWRTIVSDDTQAYTLAKYIQQHRQIGQHSYLLIVYKQEIYSEGLVNIIAQRLTEQNIVTVNKFFQSNVEIESQFEDGWTRLGLQNGEDASDVGVIFISNVADEITQFAEFALAENSTYRNATYYFADAAANQSFDNSLAGLNLTSEQKVYGTQPPQNTEDVIYDAFEEFYERYPEPQDTPPDGFVATYNSQNSVSDIFNAYTHDAIWLGLYGYAWAHYNGTHTTPFPNSTDILTGLQNLSDLSAQESRFVAGSWNPDILANGSTTNITGATGNLDYDQNTSELTTPVEFWRYTPTGQESRPAVDSCELSCTASTDNFASICTLQCCCDAGANDTLDFCSTANVDCSDNQ